MIRTYCDIEGCQKEIRKEDDPHPLTIIGGVDCRVYHYCDNHYTKVLADLIPVLRGRTQ